MWATALQCWAVMISGYCGPRPFNVELQFHQKLFGKFLFLDFLGTCCPSIEGAGSTRTHMDFLLPQHWRGQLNNRPNGFFGVFMNNVDSGGPRFTITRNHNGSTLKGCGPQEPTIVTAVSIISPGLHRIMSQQSPKWILVVSTLMGPAQQSPEWILGVCMNNIDSGSSQNWRREIFGFG